MATATQVNDPFPWLTGPGSARIRWGNQIYLFVERFRLTPKDRHEGNTRVPGVNDEDVPMFRFRDMDKLDNELELDMFQLSDMLERGMVDAREWRMAGPGG